MGKFATETKDVHDDAHGFDRRVVQGTEIPADLLDAYEAAGGKTSDSAPDESGVVVAKSTQTVTDENLGFDRKVVEGQPVPPDLVEAYEGAGGKTASEPKRSRRSRASEATDDSAGDGDE